MLSASDISTSILNVSVAVGYAAVALYISSLSSSVCASGHRLKFDGTIIAKALIAAACYLYICSFSHIIQVLTAMEFSLSLFASNVQMPAGSLAAISLDISVIGYTAFIVFGIYRTALAISNLPYHITAKDSAVIVRNGAESIDKSTAIISSSGGPSSGSTISGERSDVLFRASMKERVYEDSRLGEAADNARVVFYSTFVEDVQTQVQNITLVTDLLKLTQLSTEQIELLNNVDISKDLIGWKLSQMFHVFLMLNGRNLLPKIQVVSLPKLLKHVARIVQSLANELPVTFETSAEISDTIITDEEWVQQMLLNLLTNAVHCTNSGFIAVRVTLQSGSSGSNSTGDHNRMLQFEVTDTGTAIEPAHMGSLFEPFNSQSPRGGMHLFALRVRAEGMGGQCGVRSSGVSTDSPTGSGSVFWFTTPYTTSEDELAPGQSNWASPQRRRLPSSDPLLSAENNSSPVSPRSTVTPLMTGRNLSPPEQMKQQSDEPKDMFIAQNISSVPSGDVVVNEAGAGVAVVGTEPVRRGSGQAFCELERAAEEIASAAERAAARAAIINRTSSRAKLRAIVVEDVTSARRLMEKMLRHVGFQEIECCENGEKGLEAMKRAPVDMVFTSVLMPLMNGTEMTRLFREFEAVALATGQRSQRQAIIAVSGIGAERSQAMVHDHCFDRICPKPLSSRVIKSILQDYMTDGVV